MAAILLLTKHKYLALLFPTHYFTPAMIDYWYIAPYFSFKQCHFSS